MFVWDPSPIALQLPFFGLTITWYAFFFVFGFVISYFIMRRLLEGWSLSKEVAHITVDSLICYVGIGTLVGSRLVHLLFYDWDNFITNPGSLLKIGAGGLASHGGVLGVVTAAFLYQQKIASSIPQLTLLRLLDLICIPTSLACAFIRIGNFFNQEIVGLPTTKSWGVIFLHPGDGLAVVPRHPVQLYEAAAYFSVFVLLLSLWHFKRSALREGQLFGLSFLLCWTCRFFLEFFKAPVMAHEPFSFGLMMGQWMSLPLILVGFWLVKRGFRLNRPLVVPSIG